MVCFHQSTPWSTPVLWWLHQTCTPWRGYSVACSSPPPRGFALSISICIELWLSSVAWLVLVLFLTKPIVMLMQHPWCTLHQNQSLTSPRSTMVQHQSRLQVMPQTVEEKVVAQLFNCDPKSTTIISCNKLQSRPHNIARLHGELFPYYASSHLSFPAARSSWSSSVTTCNKCDASVTKCICHRGVMCLNESVKL